MEKVESLRYCQVLPVVADLSTDLVGERAKLLGTLSTLKGDFHVPPGICILSTAYSNHLERCGAEKLAKKCFAYLQSDYSDQDELKQLAETIQDLIMQTPLDEQLVSEIKEFLEGLPLLMQDMSDISPRVAVRSSIITPLRDLEPLDFGRYLDGGLVSEPIVSQTLLQNDAFNGEVETEARLLSPSSSPPTTGDKNDESSGWIRGTTPQGHPVTALQPVSRGDVKEDKQNDIDAFLNLQSIDEICEAIKKVFASLWLWSEEALPTRPEISDLGSENQDSPSSTPDMVRLHDVESGRTVLVKRGGQSKASPSVRSRLSSRDSPRPATVLGFASKGSKPLRPETQENLRAGAWGNAWPSKGLVVEGNKLSAPQSRVLQIQNQHTLLPPRSPYSTPHTLFDYNDVVESNHPNLNAFKLGDGLHVLPHFNLPRPQTSIGPSWQWNSIEESLEELPMPKIAVILQAYGDYTVTGLTYSALVNPDTEQEEKQEEKTRQVDLVVESRFGDLASVRLVPPDRFVVLLPELKVQSTVFATKFVKVVSNIVIPAEEQELDSPSLSDSRVIEVSEMSRCVAQVRSEGGIGEVWDPINLPPAVLEFGVLRDKLFLLNVYGGVWFGEWAIPQFPPDPAK